MKPLPDKPTCQLKSHLGAVNVVRYNSTGEYCLSGGMDRSIKLWNPNHNSEEDRLIQTFKGHGWEVFDLNLSKDNSRFVSGGGDKSVFLWDVVSCQVTRKFSGHTQKINAVDFNEDGSVIASGSYDTTVRLWDCRSQSRLPIQILEESKDSISSIQILGTEILTGSVDNKVRVYDIRMGQVSTDVMPASVTNISFTHDKNCLVVSTLDNHVRLIDKENGNLLNHYNSHVNKNYKLHSTSNYDDSVIMTGSEDGCVYFYDLLEGNLLSKHKNHIKAVLGIASHPSAQQMLTSSVDGTITVWDI